MTPLGSRFILALSASPRGFAFVVFQGRKDPFDWGVKEIRGDQKNPRTIAEVKKLIRRYQLEAIVIENTSTKDSRRGPRIRALYRAVVLLARREAIHVERYSKTQIRSAFKAENARTRPEIANAIAARIHALAPRIPPLRRIWMSEDPRQSLFDAAALGLCFYRERETDDHAQ